MKKFSLASLLLLASFFISFLAVPVLAATKTIEVATAGDIRPFSYENKKGKLTGYDIEVLRAASAYMDGYDFSFKTTAWESIFVGLDSGHYGAAANNLSYTEERAAKYLYSLPIAKNPLVLVTAKSSKIKGLNDIGGKTTQDDTGTSTAKLVEDWNKENSKNPSKISYSGEDVTKRLLDLADGEFDYLIFDKISVDTIIKQKDLDLIVIDLDTDNNPNNYLVFASDQEDLKESFNQALIKLYESGKLEKLSQKYLGGSYLPSESDLKD